MERREAVEVENLGKDFGSVRALNGLRFTINRGEVFGLIGPNGAGKTTTLRILGTILTPTSGHAKVFGHSVTDKPEEVRRLITYLPEEAGAYNNLSGEEYLRLMANLYTRGAEKDTFEKGAEISGLEHRLKDRVKTYSKGMKRRLLLARALMVKPGLSILDEPTSGLDVIHAYHVRRLIKEYSESQGVTILLSSHNMLEVEYLCDRITFIDKGRDMDGGSPSELKEKYEAQNLEEVFMKVAKLA